MLFVTFPFFTQTVEKGAEVVAALSVTETQPSKQRFLGFSAALMACMLSGFAGIYFEKILKGSNVSVCVSFLFTIVKFFISTFLRDTFF